MSVLVHRFSKALMDSHAQAADNVFWESVYRKFFPTFQGMSSLLDDGIGQRSGVDRHVTLANGRIIRVEEKVRHREYDDFCLEYLSVYKGPDHPDNAPGWMEQDLACDHIAYAFLKSGRVYLLPWPQLRVAWQREKHAWVKTYRRIRACNDGYDTISVAVPTGVVLAAIGEATLVDSVTDEVAA